MLRSPLVTICFFAVLACGGDDEESPDAATDGAMSMPDGGGGSDGDVAPDAAPDTGPPDMCSERMATLVYNGTAEPTALPLTSGQVLAIGTTFGCSGTFITDEWVILASHCGVSRGDRFCVGTNPRNPDICFRAEEVEDHPSVDMTLIRVDAPASQRAPTLEPIPINTFELTSADFGEIAEAAGYGQQEDGTSGEREFTAEPIDGFEGPFVVIDGMGERGVCFGDSGGPVMVMAEDGSVRVAGVLSWGDPNCLGRDRYTRTDRVVEWIETFTGPTVVEGGSCGVLTDEGRCVGSTAVWCDDDEVQREACEGACGWSTTDEGYRCITGTDPCDGVDNVGECRDQVAMWCDRGTLRQRNCGTCDDQVCGVVVDIGGVYCLDDPCMGVDYLGQCDGDVAVWCDEEERELRRRDCGRRGLRCDYVDDRVGYWCTR